MNVKPIALSPTAIKLFQECPRCFWLERVAGVPRPPTLFPSLPGGMDGVIKKYFDRYRAAGRLPPELEGKVCGSLFPDQARMDAWRARGKGLRWLDRESGIAVIGLLDDCLLRAGLHSPLDYKTRGYPAKENTPGYYQHQLDIYTLLLQENGYETDGWGYLVFYHPLEHGDGGQITFHLHPVGVRTDRQNALKLLREAADILSLQSTPPAAADCGFCAWADQSRKIKNSSG